MTAIGRALASAACAFGRGLAACLAIVVAVGAGIGTLYLLRDLAVLAAGPGIREALPLQRLAHGDRQPLLRVLVAWLPAALVAASALARVTRLGRPGRALAAGAGAWILLVLTGALSDAVTANETFSGHLGAQPSRAAIWLPALLFACCALMPRRAARRAAAQPAPPVSTAQPYARTRAAA